MDWFKFGGVRGLIGLAVASIQLLALAALPLPVLQPGIQQFVFGTDVQMQYVNTTILQTTTIVKPEMGVSVLALAPVIILAAFIFSGTAYWLGSKIVEYYEIRVERFWKAATCGVLGSFILGFIAIMLIYFVLLAVLSAMQLAYVATYFLIAALAGIPASIIAEIGYAGVTWQVYKWAGWKLPTE